MAGERELEGRCVLVTGGSSGIGRATALAFAGAGAYVVIGARTRPPGMETVRMIELEGGEASFVPTDVSVDGEVAELVRRAVEPCGRIDFAVNAAATTDPVLARTADLPESDVDEVFAVSLKGLWLCLRHQLPQMVSQGGGAIVNLAGLNARAGAPLMAHNAAAKHGVVGLTRSAAIEYAPDGVRVNCVAPGPTDTPLLRRTFEVMQDHDPDVERNTVEQSPMRRIASPEEIAQAILWLCSPRASFVTGEVLAVDGGLGARLPR